MAPKLFQSRRHVILFTLTTISLFTMYLLIFEVEVTRHCHRLCSGDINGPCYKKNYAVMIYTDDTPAEDMTFDQAVLPKIGLGELMKEFFSGKISYENCVVQDYYPTKRTIDRQQKCAIVGNGGILLNSRCGSEINSYDFVMRANLAPIKPFADDVGIKTNLTILNYESLHSLYHSMYTFELKLDHHDELLRRLRFLNDSIVWFSKSMNFKETRNYLQSVSYVLKSHHSLPVRLAYTWQSVSIERYWGLKHYASSGFNLFAVAQTFCSEITLYGFYPFEKDETGRRLLHHYYDAKPSDFFTNVHNIPAEYEILKRLQEEHSIRMVVEKCAAADDVSLKEPIKGDGNLEKLVDPVRLFSGRNLTVIADDTR